MAPEGTHPDLMDDDEVEVAGKSRFAMSETRFFGDVGVGNDLLVTLQPAQPPNDWVPTGGVDGDGGDGD